MSQLSISSNVNPKVNEVNFCAKKKICNLNKNNAQDNKTRKLTKFTIYATAITAATVAAITLAKKVKLKNLTEVVSEAGSGAKACVEQIEEVTSKVGQKADANAGVEQIEEVTSKVGQKADANAGVKPTEDADKNFEKIENHSLAEGNKRGSYTDEARKHYEDLIREENKMSGKSMSELELEFKAASRFFEDIIENNSAKLQNGEITFTDILYEHGSSELIKAHAESVNAFKAKTDLPEEFITEAVSRYILKCPDIIHGNADYTGDYDYIIKPFEGLSGESIINSINREINGKNLDLTNRSTIYDILMNKKNYTQESKLGALFEHYNKSSDSEAEAMEKCFEFQKKYNNYDYFSYADKILNKDEFEQGLFNILNKINKEHKFIDGVYFISKNKPIKIVNGKEFQLPTFEPSGNYLDDIRNLKNKISHLVPPAQGPIPPMDPLFVPAF